MLRRIAVVAVVLAMAGGFQTSSAQTGTPEAKPSKIRLTAERLKEMKAKWIANRPKLAACRKDVKAKGLAGDDRWFYIEECMNRN